MSLLCGGAPPALEILTLDPYSPCLSWLRIAALKPDTALRDWGDVSGRKVDSLGLGGGIPVDSIASQDSLIDVETLLWKQKMHERDLEAQAEAIDLTESLMKAMYCLPREKTHLYKCIFLSCSLNMNPGNPWTSGEELLSVLR